MSESSDFWSYLEEMVASSRLVIDRPRGSAHPRFSQIVYPLDYGYLEGTSAGDGGGIDVWVGSLGTRDITGVACTADLCKGDTEVKILLGCSEADMALIERHHSSGPMRCLIIRRGQGAAKPSA